MSGETWATLRAKFVAIHGERKTAHAESVASLRLALFVLQHATARREAAERAFLAAKEEAEEMPPDWRKDDPKRRWSGAWLPYTWGALERFAAAARRETEWALRVAELAAAAGVNAHEARAELVHSTHRWGW